VPYDIVYYIQWHHEPYICPITLILCTNIHSHNCAWYSAVIFYINTLVPDDFFNVLSKYTRRGCRVLAVAYRSISIKAHKVDKIKRSVNMYNTVGKLTELQGEVNQRKAGHILSEIFFFRL